MGVNSFALSHRDIPDETDACTAKFFKEFLYRWLLCIEVPTNTWMLSYVTGNENPERT